MSPKRWRTIMTAPCGCMTQMDSRGSDRLNTSRCPTHGKASAVNKAEADCAADNYYDTFIDGNGR